VPAFTSSASNHLGYVTALTPIPMLAAEVGGGVSNGLGATGQWIAYWNRNRRNTGGVVQPPPSIDTSGPYGLSQQNHANIAQGYQQGLIANQPPSAFKDYGYAAQPPRASKAIGDGNGIVPFLTSLTGVDPDEPRPSDWPPEPNAAVRYLSSYRARY
jgi:hypothetical protein